MAHRREYAGTRSSQFLLAVAGTGLAALWVGVAPHVVVRRWTADANPAIQCRQTLTGTRQWSDPAIGRVAWTRDDVAGVSYC
jgi:hypothetical protein